MTELVLYHGDCIDVMRRLDAESVDAVVTDPPYGLEFMGKEWDKFRVDDAGTLGRPRTGDSVGAQGGFKHGTLSGDSTPGVVIGGGRRPTTNRCVTCGRRDQFRKRHHPCGDGVWRAEVIDPHAAPPTSLAFQEWCRCWATEALRVLKPGGHLLAFGGTRTYHRLTSGIEDAGFEIRDTIAWLYGQGFPKSLDVSKAIDAQLGAERDRQEPQSRASPSSSIHPTGFGADGWAPQVNDATTPEAEAWQGWGTALKPAHEPIVVARKPLRGNVAQTVLEFGTGGLNIDATRIAISDEDRLTIDTMGGYGEPDWIAPSPGVALEGSVDGSLNRRGTQATAHELGRHPANVALGHSDDCKPIGTRKVRGARTRERSPDGPAAATWSLGREGGEQTGYADEEGFETIARWDCAPGCAVAMLDAQSGDLKAGGRPGKRAGIGYGSGALGTTGVQVRLEGGGASRFFYTAKASTRERNKGLSHLQAELTGSMRAAHDGSLERNRPNTPKANVHPTVKPLDLMHWLVRMVAPPDGVILDPFAGSGTTGVACRLEHVRCILIEADADYLPIIAGRLGVQATPEGEMRLERTRIPDPERTRKGRAGAFACPHCDLAFTDRSLYARHWRSSHDPRRPPTEGAA